MMKAKGYIRRVDRMGRIVIPKNVRRRIDIQPGDSMAIFADEAKGRVIIHHRILKIDKSIS